MEEKEVTINQALAIAEKFHTQGNLDEAKHIYEKILEKNPLQSDALHLRGLIKHQKGNHDEAIEDIKKAIEIMPNGALYYNNLGMIYDTLRKKEESIKNLKKALEIDPKYKNSHLAYYNLGVYYDDKREIMQALESYNKSIELEKDFFEAHWNKSLLLLLLGKFKEGWEEYEYRFMKNNSANLRTFDRPKWDGSSLEGKRILVVSEQGFGDNIQFIRYIPLVKEKKGYIILECNKKLINLFKTITEIDEFVEKEDNCIQNIEFDLYINLMSLPKIFDTQLENVPNKIPYLRSNINYRGKFKENFNKNKFKIGIVWAGNTNQMNDEYRSTTFDKFKILKQIPGILLFSLQKEKAASQLDDPEVIDLSKDINDFEDTASIIKELDLIISVDTSVAHLAGAMGKPVWTLLAFNSDWRWLLERKDSPWYPSMKLFRQKKLGDWDSVFKEICEELKKMLDKREF